MFFDNVLMQYLDSCKIIPLQSCPTRFYTISFEGWEDIEISSNNDTCYEVLEIASASLIILITKYKDTHAFTEPYFSFMPDTSQIQIKIATMPNDLYENVLKSINERKDRQIP